MIHIGHYLSVACQVSRQTEFCFNKFVCSLALTAQTSFDVYTFINAFQFHSLKSLNSINYNSRFVAECIKYQTQDPKIQV